MKLATLIVLALLTLWVAPSCAQDLPAPGTTIDKANYEKYAHLFPKEFAPAFIDGFGGTIAPMHVNVVPKKAGGIPQAYMYLSLKNKGKYSLDQQGNITGGWSFGSFPFPDLNRDDKDFAAKLMWNYAARYQGDDHHDIATAGTCQKIKGEEPIWAATESPTVMFKGRIVCDPKPALDNPDGLYRGLLSHYRSPEKSRNNINLIFRYADPDRGDDIYMFTTSMRRPMRMEGIQRSAPISGINSLDDTYLFDGVVRDFVYTLVGEQKVLGITDSTLKPVEARRKKGEVPVPYDSYEVRDTYVIDIKPKDPKYPQSLKRVWMDKDLWQPLYAVAFDRSNKLWKVWMAAYKRYPAGKDDFALFRSSFGVDVQYGMATAFYPDREVNTCEYDYMDVSLQALLKRGR